MKHLFLKTFLGLSIVAFPYRGWAQLQILNPYPVTENAASVEKIIQQVQADLSLEEEKKGLDNDEKKREMKDPKKDSAKVKENKSSADVSEYPPYADEKLRSELSKEKPDIPTVEGLIKQTFVYKSETVNLESTSSKEMQETDERNKDDNAGDEANSLEKLQMQTIIVYENARAIARRTLDLIAKAEADEQEIRKEAESRKSTGSVQKGIASSIMYRTHQLLNEIATIRNSYIEINAINTIQGTEAPEKEGLMDRVTKSVLGG